MHVNWRRVLLLALLVLVAGRSQSQANLIASFDVIDEFLKVASNYQGPQSYDIFDGAAGAAGQDGVADIRVSISSTGVTADDGNNVQWTVTNDTTGTGLRSTIDPSFVGSGGVTSLNSGNRATQTIQIDFLSGMTVEAQDIVDFGWSSGNTAGIGWETSILEYLDSSLNPFSTTPVIPDYLDNVAPTDGQSGTGTFVADSTGTVQGVGTTQTSSGSSGSNNGLSTSATGLGIGATDLIGGVRFTHILEDVRGTGNGDTSFTATINDLELQNFDVAPAPVPEPSALSGLMVCGVSLMFRRRRRV